jgi:hypothetical protein
MNKPNPTNQSETIESVLEARVRAWQTAHPDATLSAIEEEIDRELARLRKQLVSTALEERDAPDAPVMCPDCSREMHVNGRRQRQLQIKGGETVSFERRQMRCPECGRTLFPPG